MRYYKMLLFALLISVPLVVYAQSHDKDKGKVSTIDDLAKKYDVLKCKECHKKEFNEWSGSLHAMSLFGTGRTAATLRNTIIDGLMKEQPKSGVKDVADIKKEHLMQCFKCHLPQIEDATDDVAREIAQAAIDGDDEKLKKVNINCLICHNKKAIIHKYHYGEPEPNVVYGNKDGQHPTPDYPTHKKSVIMQEAVMCGQCHGLGPNFDQPNPSQCATLYGSYLHSYIPSGGTETCQDCHMRKFRKGHHFSSYRDPDVGPRAVEVVVEAPGYQFLPKAGDWNPTVVLTVKLTNKAGHRIPDG